MPAIHANARTTPAVRAEIARSREPSGVLAKRYGVSTEALVGFRGGVTGSRNQACDKGAEQGSPTPARIVNELEEAEIKRQLVLRNASVRAEPGAQQGP